MAALFRSTGMGRGVVEKLLSRIIPGNLTLLAAANVSSRRLTLFYPVNAD